MNAHLRSRPVPSRVASRPHPSGRRWPLAGMTLFCALGIAAAGCASFADAPPSFSPQPTLTPNIATVIPSDAGGIADQLPPTSGGAPTTGSPGQTGGPDGTADPCTPQPLPVVAVCLDAPWGLAPLPSGDTALVGERVTGRILSVTAGTRPVELATVADIDASQGGGLLGIALSPYYAEDQLIYAYVTTATDARIVRFAVGQAPKAIVTGLPAGGEFAGGSIAFDASGLLYVATGSAPPDMSAPEGSMTSDPAPSAPLTSVPSSPPVMTAPEDPDTPPTGAAQFGDPALASAVLRFDTFGRPAPGNSSGTALFATGFSNIGGMCPLPTGQVGVIDHRAVGDVLLPLADGADFTRPDSAATLWTYRAGGGGALDCAVADGALLATARTEPSLTRIEMRSAGGFTGAPSSLLDGEYGLLRTLTTGPGDMAWMTTANNPPAREADGRGPLPIKPDPSDDRVIVLPPGGGGGGDGGID